MYGKSLWVVKRKDTRVTQTSGPLMPHDDNGTCLPVHLDSRWSNSCHFNCMIPVFIAIHQATPLGTGEEVTKQAQSYFKLVAEMDAGKTKKISRSLKVRV